MNTTKQLARKNRREDLSFFEPEPRTVKPVLQMNKELNDYAVESSAVSDLSAAEQTRCLCLIVEGGAVDAETAKRNFPQSVTISLARKDGEVVGVASIKPLRERYAKGIAMKAKFPFDPKTPELGYVVVDDAHRGKRLSSRMVTVLAKDGGALFATTSDPKMKSALNGAGFRQCGFEWQGCRGDLISLWIKC